MEVVVVIINVVQVMIMVLLEWAVDVDGHVLVLSVVSGVRPGDRAWLGNSTNVKQPFPCT